MLRTKTLKLLFVSAACAAGLAAQNSRQPQYEATPYNDPPPPPASASPASTNYDENIPPTLTLRAGTFVTVRVDDGLSSDHNQPGDTFYATLTQPLVVDGVVVARRGATVMGRISEAQKAGRVQGTSRLGLQLTNLTLVDGQQIPIQSQVIDRNGDTSVGDDAAAIGVTTGMGAAIGAAAGGGKGAAIGAGAGAIASTLGVLLTRGRPTEIYPETQLTFRIDTTVPISTARATAAFHYADQQDYGQGNEPQPRVAVRRPPVAVAPPPPYYGRPYYYDPYYYPYYGGFSLYVGPRYYGGYFGIRGGRGFRR